MKVFAYVRVSTQEQSVETQLHAIENYCKTQGWKVNKIYRDVGVSGSIDQRQSLDDLKKEVIKGGVDILVVWKFDRLARSTSHLLECLKLFQSNNTSFVSVTEGVDTSTSVGRMVLTFLGAIGEFEREIIKERVKAGLDRARNEGITLGRPRKGFDIGQALKLKREGWSYKKIGKKLGVSTGTVFNSLKAISSVQ